MRIDTYPAKYDRTSQSDLSVLLVSTHSTYEPVTRARGRGYAFPHSHHRIALRGRTAVTLEA